MSSHSRERRDETGHLPAGTFPIIAEIPTGQAAMHQRICELEALCAEFYEAAVWLGLPPTLLERLWTVAAHGNSPQGFSIDLPIAEAGAPAHHDEPLPDVRLTHHPEVLIEPLAKLPPLLERKTVMVVEDDPAMLELILKILETENYELIAADDGDAALQRWEDESASPDLLITDLMMPGMTGLDLAATMRARAPGLRILYQTGFTDTLFKAKNELEPGAAFLEKPFSARGLVEAARFVLFGTIDPSAARAREAR